MCRKVDTGHQYLGIGNAITIGIQILKYEQIFTFYFLLLTLW